MSFRDIWGAIREKFPPARAVAFLTPIALPLLAYVNTWIADHAPWVEQYVGQDQRMGIFVGTIAAGVALAYKWLDGRAKWETAQVEASVELAKLTGSPAAAIGQVESVTPGALPEPDVPPQVDHVPDLDTGDDDFELSQPDDIAESDIDDAEADERRAREPLPERE